MPSFEKRICVVPPPGGWVRASGAAEGWIAAAVRPLGWAADTAARGPELS